MVSRRYHERFRGSADPDAYISWVGNGGVVSDNSRKRPWIAVVLAIVYPGLGHVYLRVWHRALLWFVAVVLTASLFIPEAVYTDIAEPSDVLGVAASIPTEAAVAVALVAAFNVIDAYVTANRSNASIEGNRCPHCGREVDESLDFCHWCTARF